MKAKQYKKINKLFFFLVLLTTLISFFLETALIAFFVLGFYLFIMSLLRTRVEGVLVDERQQSIAGKASQISFQILLPILALTTLAFLFSGGKSEFYFIKALGTIFSYIVCLGLVIYFISYLYFDKKTGGR